MIKYYVLKHFPNSEFDNIIDKYDLLARYCTNPSYKKVALIFIVESKTLIVGSSDSSYHLKRLYLKEEVEVYNYEKGELIKFIDVIKNI